jgi:Rad3-related DNA helicase
MRKFFILFVPLFLSFHTYSQQNGAKKPPADSTGINTGDSIPVINLDEVTLLPDLYFSKSSDWYRYLVLRKRVLKVYPFAKQAGEDLRKLDERLQKMSPRQRRRYKKAVERYIKKVIEPELKELYVQDGRVLVRLVYRQTGMSVYDFLKKYKSGLSAYWWQRIAKLYKIDLKEKYDPENRKTDFWMEDILQRAFAEGELEQSPPAFDIPYHKLFKKWMEKMPGRPKIYRKFERRGLFPVRKRTEKPAQTQKIDR